MSYDQCALVSDMNVVLAAASTAETTGTQAMRVQRLMW